MSHDMFAAECQAHRSYLLKVARLELNDDALAEDAVQETLLAALQGQSRFDGRASLKTWLTSILRHKVVDTIRSRSRHVAIGEHEFSSDDVDADFDEREHWGPSGPQDWRTPELAFANAELQRVLESCLRKLAPGCRRAFAMREVHGMDTAEICDALTVTENNLGVLLYRARMSMRKCLERNWFAVAERART